MTEKTDSETGSDTGALLPPTPTLQKADDSLDELAGRLSETEFISIVAWKDGECLSTAGLIGKACKDLGTPYHIRTVSTIQAGKEAIQSSPGGTVIGVGIQCPDGLEIAPAPNQSFELPKETENTDESASETTSEPVSEEDGDEQTPESGDSEFEAEESDADTESGNEPNTPQDETSEDDGVETDSDGDEDRDDDEMSETDAALFTDGGVPVTDEGQNISALVDLNEYNHPPVIAAYLAVKRIPDAEPPNASLALAGLRASPTYNLRANPETEIEKMAKKSFGLLSKDASQQGARLRPGVGVPTSDKKMEIGIAFSLRFTSPYSGSTDGVLRMMSGLGVTFQWDDEAHQKAENEIHESVREFAETDRAEDAIFSAIHVVEPGEGLVAETVEGYADVVDVVARSSKSGIATALVMGADVWSEAFQTWKRIGKETQMMIRQGFLEDDGSCCVLSSSDGRKIELVDACAAARLVFNYKTDADVVLVEGGREVGVMTDERNRDAVESAIREVVDESAFGGREFMWRIGVGKGSAPDVVEALREEL